MRAVLKHMLGVRCIRTSTSCVASAYRSSFDFEISLSLAIAYFKWPLFLQVHGFRALTTMPTRTSAILLVACLGVALALPKVVLKADNGKTTAITWDGAELHVPQHCDQRCIDHFSNKIANVEKMLTEVIKRVDALDHSHTDIKKISESTHQKLEHYHPPTQYPTPAPTPQN